MESGESMEPMEEVPDRQISLTLLSTDIKTVADQF